MYLLSSFLSFIRLSSILFYSIALERIVGRLLLVVELLIHSSMNFDAILIARILKISSFNEIPIKPSLIDVDVF